MKNKLQLAFTDNFSCAQTVRKPAVCSHGGIVAAQHRQAAEIGAKALADGGDAVDAAVATSFALGVLEPWMSGPAGGGAMVLWRENEQKAEVINFGMRSPASLDPADYSLAGTGRSSDLFPWSSVIDDRNVVGPASVAVPGTVAGMGLAHTRYGRMDWTRLLQPAISAARQGLLIDWYAALLIASSARTIAIDPASANIWLEDGQWPPVSGWTTLSEKRIKLDKIADTLDRLAEAGWQDFYSGDIASTLARDVQAAGGCLSMADLEAYQAESQAPLVIPYRNGRVLAPPGLTAGPSLQHCLELLSTRTMGESPGGEAYTAYASVLRSAYAQRLSSMGDADDSRAPGCTTHFSIVDRHGNMAAVTQTLLSMFGSKYTSPSTGLLMNNGIMWFDPEPGKPNSLAGNKRCLMNVCPVIGESGETRFALGAAGGRKILPAVMQLSSFMMDYNMDLETAFHQPRIDASGDTVIADQSLDEHTLKTLAATFPTALARRTVFPYAFACPSGVARINETNFGCTEIMSPWGDAVAESR